MYQYCKGERGLETWLGNRHALRIPNKSEAYVAKAPEVGHTPRMGLTLSKMAPRPWVPSPSLLADAVRHHHHHSPPSSIKDSPRLPARTTLLPSLCHTFPPALLSPKLPLPLASRPHPASRHPSKPNLDHLLGDTFVTSSSSAPG